MTPSEGKSAPSTAPVPPLPKAVVEAVMRSICDDIYGPATWDLITPESRDSFRCEATRRVTVAWPHLRRQVIEGCVEAVFHVDISDADAERVRNRLRALLSAPPPKEEG